MDTLFAIAILVIMLWIGLGAVYIFLGRQQNNIQDDIEQIQKILHDDDSS